MVEPVRESRFPEAHVATLQERVSGVILEAAAHVLAVDGREASMGDIAGAAGVARATIYRYFASRSALLDELARLAVERAGERLSSARVDEVGAVEGVARAVRALLDVGDLLLVLARERVRPDPGAYDRVLLAPLRRMIEVGQSAGQLRTDLPPSWLSESLVSLVVAVRSARPAQGREDTAAAIASLFLEGTRPRPSAVTEE
jgi:AcrR family transcriptional regulator